MTKRDRGFSHLRVIDLRLVQDRNDEWHLFVEGVEISNRHVPRVAGFRSFAEYLAKRINRTDTPFPARLWTYFWFKKPWGAP